MKHLHTLLRSYLYFILDGNLTQCFCSHKRGALDRTGRATVAVCSIPGHVAKKEEAWSGQHHKLLPNCLSQWDVLGITFRNVFLCSILLHPAHLFCQLLSSHQILSYFVLFAENYFEDRQAGRYKESPKHCYVIILQFSLGCKVSE